MTHGLTIRRDYFLLDHSAASVAQASVGDLVTIRLTLTVPQDIRYVAVEDPIPAGTEAVNSSLLTSSHRASAPELRRETDNPAWQWGWWWFTRADLRDAQTNLYADYLPRGKYTYSYTVRASVPGVFQAMPARAFAFYEPDVFGRTNGALFTVK